VLNHHAYIPPRLIAQAIDKKTGFTTKHILCMPFKDRQGRIVAVVQAVNKPVAAPSAMCNAS